METSKTTQIEPVMPIWLRIPVFLIAFLIVTGTFQLIGVILAGIPLDELSNMSSAAIEKVLVLEFFSLIPLLLIVFIFRKYIDRQTILSLGFSIKNRNIDLLFGLLVAIVIIVGGSILLSGFGLVNFTYVGLSFKQIAFSFLLFVLVALTEEIMVRGYILNNLLMSVNKYVALIISAVLFMALHGFNPNLSLIAFVNLFLAGMVLGATYIFTKNLWFPISLHLFWNFLQGPVLGYHVSGQETDSE